MEKWLPTEVVGKIGENIFLASCSVYECCHSEAKCDNQSGYLLEGEGGIPLEIYLALPDIAH